MRADSCNDMMYSEGEAGKMTSLMLECHAEIAFALNHDSLVFGVITVSLCSGLLRHAGLLDDISNMMIFILSIVIDISIIISYKILASHHASSVRNSSHR